MLRIVEAKKEDRDIMMNLLEKYLYEFSQWEKTDVNDSVETVVLLTHNERYQKQDFIE